MASSGRPLAEWAREHGIDGRSLNAWRVNLGRRESRATKANALKSQSRRAPSGLVELVPTSLPRMAAGGAGHYVLEVGSARVEFGDDFQEDTLRRIVRVLRAC
ncbi:MAG: hypothetical protein IPI43_05800 [Sandaracinaceae bacterium]|nr:hypothetical protein [Sandaracinaceae bacterium]